MFCIFFPWSLVPFWDITYAKKHTFLRPSSGDLLLNEKQKEPIVSLNHGVSIIHKSPTTQVAQALNGPDLSLFCHDAGSIWGGGRCNFFPLFFPSSFKTQDLCNWIAVFNRLEGSGLDMSFSWNRDVEFWRTKHQLLRSHKFRAYLLIKQSLLVISTDIWSLFEEYL